MNSNTLLHRQVHPNWIMEGRATSQTFTPTPKDENRLSVHDGDRISAESAWELYTRQGFRSYGVLAVTKGECDLCDLGVVPDPLPESPEHILIDFTGKSRNRAKRVAQRLTRMASARGWMFRPQ